MGRPRSATGPRQKRGGGAPQLGMAMSWDQIGKLEGITHGGAFMAYKSGIRKLRQNHPIFLAVLAELAEDMQRSRAARRSLYEPEIAD